MSAHELNPETLVLTTKLLNRNPEYYTIWNYRRLILQNLFPSPLETEVTIRSSPDHMLDMIRSDMTFLMPLLVQFPKCYWIWNHRSWLLQQGGRRLPVQSTFELWQEELQLVRKMLSRDSRNFHCWGYRRLVIEQLETFSRSETDERSQVEAEFAFTTKMIQSNLSNFSAWHYRSQLIPRLLHERGSDDAARRELLDNEFSLIQRALYTDPYDQSLWFYYQYLMSNLSTTDSGPPVPFDFTPQDRVTYFERELNNLREMLQGAEDCKWIYQNLVQQSDAYLKLGHANKVVTPEEILDWLTELQKLDPLRSGRWDDLAQSLRF